MIKLYSNNSNYNNISLQKNKIQKKTNNIYHSIPDKFIQVNHYVNFEGNKKNKTTNGKFLKDLRNITDPYSGVILISNEEMDKISEELKHKPNINEKLKYLKKYEKSMLPVEHNIYKMFEVEASKNKFTTFSKILQKEKNNSLKKLQEEQLKVIDKISEKTNNLTGKNKRLVNAELDEAKDRIKKDINEKHSFKRKVFIEHLIKHQCNNILDTAEKKLLSEYHFEEVEKIEEARESLENRPLNQAMNGKTPVDLALEIKHKYLPNYNDPYKEIIEIARELPTSNTSTNAFIVKYADRSENEISERLLNGSTYTIEHITADSLGGENEADNFILVSKARNEARGNLPLKVFIKQYPGIPKYTQKYMNDVILNANQGKLKDYEWYPYVLKDKLESTGINVNLDKYKIPPEEAFKTLPPRLRNRYPVYQKYIPDRTEPLNIKA